MKTHKIAYRVLNKHMGDTPRDRELEVHATREELKRFQIGGFLIRKAIMKEPSIEIMRNAIDQLAEHESGDKKNKTGDSNANAQENRFGLVLRHLLDKNEVFHPLLTWPPALSIARAMMGPIIRLRGLSARVTYAQKEPQETPWHQHLRVFPKPIPPWFSQPHAIDCLIYLDELNDKNGALSVVPGSHLWLDQEPPTSSYTPLEEEATLRLPKGSMIMIHSNLWHRALPTLTGTRRMLILSYTPTWLRESPHGGPPPVNGLSKNLLVSKDPEIRELLGLERYS